MQKCKNAKMPCRFMRPPLHTGTARPGSLLQDPPAARAHIRKMLVSPWADSRRRQRDQLSHHHHISLAGFVGKIPRERETQTRHRQRESFRSPRFGSKLHPAMGDSVCRRMNRGPKEKGADLCSCGGGRPQLGTGGRRRDGGEHTVDGVPARWALLECEL